MTKLNFELLKDAPKTIGCKGTATIIIHDVLSEDFKENLKNEKQFQLRFCIEDKKYILNVKNYELIEVLENEKRTVN